MIERRTRKRVNYFASDKNMQKCVMTAWLSVIKKNDHDGVAFTLVEINHVCTDKEKNEQRP